MESSYSYEEAMEKIKELDEEKLVTKGILRSFEMKKLFPENLSFVEDIDETLSGYYGIYGFYYLKIKNSYLMFPLDENNRVRVESIEKINEKWLDILTNSLNRYSEMEERIKEAENGINQLLDSEKLRLLFKKRDEE